MKVSNLLSLFAACNIAASAPLSDFLASSSPKLDGTTALTLGKDYDKYSFELSINEYCSIVTQSGRVQSELQVFADSIHSDSQRYDWSFGKGSTRTFPLGNTDILVRHDFDAPGTSSEHRDCESKDDSILKESCIWCEKAVQGEEIKPADQFDCFARSEPPGVSADHKPRDQREETESLQHRTINCHIWRETTSVAPLVFQLSPDEVRNIVPAAAVEAPAPVTDDGVVTTSLDASALEARTIADNGNIPENLYRFGIAHSEWCENGALKARGWMSGRELNFYTDVTQKIPISLHPGRDLLIGPYSYNQHAFGVEYDGCVWTSEGGWPCGWCEAKPWTSEPLNCQTLQPGFQRTSYRTCYFVDNHMKGKARRDIEPASTPSTLPAFSIVGLVQPSVITSPPHLINITSPEYSDLIDSPDPTPVKANAYTLTLMPEVIRTVLPNTPKETEDWVFPFHIQVWESCISGSRVAAGVWRNGNMAQSLNFSSGELNLVSHRIAGFAPNYSIDFDYETSRVRFGYPWTKERGSRGACEWFDDESWRSCAECREKLWSGPRLDCADPSAVGMRVKDMECSMLLVPKPRFELVPS